MDIILASSSRYRKQLLAQVNINARCIAPDIDEAAHYQEQPKAQALRLAIAKTHHIAQHAPHVTIIGSDQVASLNGVPLGKPGGYEKAVQQLQLQSGQTVLFHTAVCVRKGPALLSDVVTTEVEFRPLTSADIEDYLKQEQPFDCAGSFKSEGLGLSLFKRVTSDDPSALIGLPLITTLNFLRTLGAR
ncbi:Maf family protein [Marinagarivorans algicola]|uniref:Maf family protein n=1 Tax=Marinagarivorans algicola TaxID=1513270 RepID=UPI0006B926DA|nr:Maf family protein [Marinagarivorans algicola]